MKKKVQESDQFPRERKRIKGTYIIVSAQKSKHYRDAIMCTSVKYFINTILSRYYSSPRESFRKVSILLKIFCQTVALTIKMNP